MKIRIHRSLFLAACLATTSWPVQAADKDVLMRLAALESAVSALQATQVQQRAHIAVLTAHLAAANARVANLEAALGGLAGSPIFQLAPFVRLQTGAINGLKGPHVIFEGVNVHVRSGSGSSDDGVGIEMPGSGLGNLIIGYNEWPGTNDPAPFRTGSHCVVVGIGHSYLSPIGIVAGYGNTLAEGTASILGGSNNSATSGSAILGGYTNKTDHSKYPDWHFTHQCISGGANNTVEWWAGSVSGGHNNTAVGSCAVVSGGENNATSEAWCATVSGGSNNIAAANWASISGGRNNSASGNNSSVSGGSNRQAAGDDDWTAGALFQDN